MYESSEVTMERSQIADHRLQTEAIFLSLPDRTAICELRFMNRDLRSVICTNMSKKNNVTRVTRTQAK